MLTDADHKRIQALIVQLNADSFKERDKASRLLVAEGLPALPLLQKPPTGATLEQARRMERCAKAIERPGWYEALAAAARLLAHHAPQEAPATLVAFLPFAPQDLPDEVLFVLDELTNKAGKVDAAIAAVLTSPHPIQRATAAVLVGAYGSADQRKGVLPLLDDEHPLVRFDAAQGLLAGGNRAAVPVLVHLLKHGPAPLAENAEALLLELAAKTAPKIDWRDTKEGREKSFSAWLAWWNQHKDRLELPKAVGLQLASGERLARDVGLKCFQALAGVDKATLSKVAAVPFRYGDGRTITTIDDLYELLNSTRAPEELLKQFTFNKVVTVKEFLTITRQEFRDYLNSLHGGKFFVVCWNIPGANTQLLGLVVRVRGATARAIGVVST
jgi:hypothetical protein